MKPTGGVASLVASDGVPLAYRRVAPECGRPRAILVHVHGIQSHGGWYVDTAAEAARRGCVVYLLDRRGSGASPGARGYFPSRRRLRDDLGRFIAFARSHDPGVPVVLVGACWGAKLAVTFALEAQAELAGLALVCPALRVKVDLGLADKLRVGLGHLLSPQSTVPIPLTPEMFTRDPDRLAYIRNDPLALRRASARLFFETFWLDREVVRTPARLRLPLLVLQASPDPIVDEVGVRRWFDAAGSRDKRFVAYPGSDHLLDFDAGRQRYWDQLLAWVETIASDATKLEHANGAPARAAR